METYTIEQVSISDSKPWAKKGKSGTMYPVGLKINGNWYNATFFKESLLDRFKTLKKGDKVILELFKDEYNGKYYDKFKFPDETEMLADRVKTLEEFIKKLVKLNNLVTKENSFELL